MPEGADSGAASGVAASGAAPAPALPASTPSAAAHSLVPQPQTYMGTLPFSPAMQCTAQRVTLTLALNGRWRGRVAYLESDAKQGAPVVEQGCWDATDERPSRVILLDGKGNVRAELAAAANNVLRVRSIAGQTPNLNYNLTRQPDLDPIDELAKAAAPLLERRRQRLNATGSYPGCPAVTRQARLLAGLRVSGPGDPC